MTTFSGGWKRGENWTRLPPSSLPFPFSYHFRRTNTFPFQVFVFFFFRTLFFLPSLLGWLGIWQEEVGGEDEEGAYFGGKREKCPLLLSRVLFSLAGCRRRLYCHNHQLFCYSVRVRPYVASRQESSTQELALFYRAFFRTCPRHVERVCMAAAALPPITQKLWDSGRRKFCLVAWPKSSSAFHPPLPFPSKLLRRSFPNWSAGRPVGRRGDTTEGKKTDKLFRRQF